MLALNSSRTVAAALGLALLAIGIAVGLRGLRGPSPAPVPSQDGPGQIASGTAPANPETVESPALSTPNSEPSPPADRPAPERRVALDPTTYAQQLIAGLTNIDLSQGKLTPEQAEQLKQRFQALAAQGAAALPTIRALLQQNQDSNFGKGSGDSVGVPSLRTGLLETLKQIGGPDALAVSRQILQNTSDPLEIAQIARNLEETAPGEYSQDAADAARAMLDKIAQGQMTNNVDVGPLFQALENYGGTNAIGDLANFASRWNYYASLALAGLPAGQGIPVLTQMAMDASETGVGNKDFAAQMLAQVSSKYSEAGTALVALAQQNQIPDSAWPSIAEVLGGMQFQFTRRYPDNMFNTVDGPSLRTYRQPNGNQNFLGTSSPSDTLIMDLNQRVALVDQLLAANPSPAAMQALQQTRARLSGIAQAK